MPEDGRLSEMKPGNNPDIEAAKHRSRLARRHIGASHFCQMGVSGGVADLSPQLVDGQELKKEYQ
jgi:hypothetical protein